MGQFTELNNGEIKIKFTSPSKGRISFNELGISKDAATIDSGFLRIVFDLEGIGEHAFFHVPTIEVSYLENVSETHWQCDFNEKTILDKTDHHGNSTVILLNRKTLASLEHHHENKLVLHAEFPEPIHLDLEKSYINFFK